LCLDILDLHYAIRFVVVVSMSSAKILAVESRHEVASLLADRESELAIMQALIRMAMNKTWEKRLGKVIYSSSVYDKLKVATISMDNISNNDNSNSNDGIVVRTTTAVAEEEEEEEEQEQENDSRGGNDDLLLMVSFEKEADHDTIITRKLLPFLKRFEEGLVMAG
jgi:hypothetical protein